ncbi:hypothetical protein DD595_25055 [Enterobacter cloacae complex sp. 4DZ3-17B2]|nr:hypothetical protein DD595_25055 [Enterobacter cloacae complex sp. 4DZ3-17B2]
MYNMDVQWKFVLDKAYVHWTSNERTSADWVITIGAQFLPYHLYNTNNRIIIKKLGKLHINQGIV